MSELEISQLLRCVCCYEWQVAALRSSSSAGGGGGGGGSGGSGGGGGGGGGDTVAVPRVLPHPEQGKGFVLHTDAARLQQLQAVAEARVPRGKEACVATVVGRDLFLDDPRMAAADGGVAYLSLNPEDPTPSQAGRFTMLTAPVFPALKYMAAGLRLEAALGKVVELLSTAATTAGSGGGSGSGGGGSSGGGGGGGGGGKLPVTAEGALLVNHVFFCFDTCQAVAEGIQPLNAVAEEVRACPHACKPTCLHACMRAGRMLHCMRTRRTPGPLPTRRFGLPASRLGVGV